MAKPQSGFRPKLVYLSREFHGDPFSGIRDKLIHDYTMVNLEVVWKTIIDDLPELIVKLHNLISILEQCDQTNP